MWLEQGGIRAAWSQTGLGRSRGQAKQGCAYTRKGFGFYFKSNGVHSSAVSRRVK